MRLTLAILISLAVGALAGGFGYWGWQQATDRALGQRWAETPSDRPLYQNRLELFEALPDGPEVVMLGDSLTQWGEWSELLGRPVANRGIGGDTSTGLLARLDTTVPKTANTVVVMIGTNDLRAEAWSAEVTAANVRQILEKLKGRRVILQSVLYGADDDTNRRIDGLNAALKAECRPPGCTWLDLNPAVFPTGRMLPEEGHDGRHLSGIAYLRWAAALKPLL